MAREGEISHSDEELTSTEHQKKKVPLHETMNTAVLRDTCGTSEGPHRPVQYLSTAITADDQYHR